MSISFLVKCFLSWFPIVLSCHISLCLDNICLPYSTKANPCKPLYISPGPSILLLFYLPQSFIRLNLTESLAVLAEVQNNGWEVLCEICDIWQNLLLSFTYKWSSVSGPDVSQSPSCMKVREVVEGNLKAGKEKIVNWARLVKRGLIERTQSIWVCWVFKIWWQTCGRLSWAICQMC